MRLFGRRVTAALAVVMVLLLAGFAWAVTTPSGYYVFWPDEAHPAADYLHVPGGEKPDGRSGFYFVDVHELEANKLEEFWGRHLQDGADLIPVRDLRSPGVSESQRVHHDFQAMADSQRTAEVVAEQALGKPVKLARLGALVYAVSNGLPAAKAGVRPGDIITAVDGHPVHDDRDLIRLTNGLSPGDTAAYTFRDAGKKTLRTVESSDGKHRAIIGVAIGDAVRIERIPIHVRYTIHGIGGPSAGLAFALEIYDSLSGRTLLDGHRIAATGELDLAGDVETIGGAKQKALGAVEAGADTFIVPVDNVAAARKAAAGRLRVIGVRTFQQALAAVRRLPPI
ncbi:MAG TPA: PDZ domain-containing protein [Gaiellales bacterium]|nr:PDZ domain-containing protein [Gaiellales bacterium]